VRVARLREGRRRLGRALRVEHDGPVVGADGGAALRLQVAEVPDGDAGREEALRDDEELDDGAGAAAAVERAHEAALGELLDVLERRLPRHPERVRDLLRVARPREQVQQPQPLDVGERVEVLREGLERVDLRLCLRGCRRHGVVRHRGPSGT